MEHRILFYFAPLGLVIVFLLRVTLCAMMVVGPIIVLTLAKLIGEEGRFFAPTLLHSLLILTPTISTMATLLGWRRLRRTSQIEGSHPSAQTRTRSRATVLFTRLATLIAQILPLKTKGDLRVRRVSKATRNGKGEWSALRVLIGLVQGAAIVVSASYAFILSLLIWPASGNFFLGLVRNLVRNPVCVIFLSPHLCLVGTALLRRWVIRGQQERELFLSRSLFGGICLGGMLLVVAEAPRTVTRYVLCGEQKAESPPRITPLRYVGDWETLARAAHGSDEDQLTDFFHFTWASLSSVQSRQEEFRISESVALDAIALLTGEEPEIFLARYSRRKERNAVVADEARGRQIVGEEIEGLTLMSTTLRGSIDAGVAVAYFEWELIFRNNSETEQEARAEIILPFGGVVSRASLWVNGVEREAAITTKGRAQTGYQNIVHLNRDPLLVSEVSPGVVFLQCFPVPPVWQSPQNIMRVKIGITAPVQLTSFNDGSLSLPVIRGQNFSPVSDTLNRVVVGANTPLSSIGAIRFFGDAPRDVGPQADLNPDILIPRPDLAPGKAYTLSFPGWNPAKVRTIIVERLEDFMPSRRSFSTGVGNRIIEQIFHTSSVKPPRSLVLVIDGSAPMRESLPLLEQLIDSISPSTNLSVYLAGDVVEELVPSQSIPTERTKEKIKQHLRWHPFLGAADNGVALRVAMQEIRQMRIMGLIPDGPKIPRPQVVWIHGQQSYLFSSYEQLRELLWRQTETVPLISIQVGGGRDSLSDSLSWFPEFRPFEHILSNPESLRLIRCQVLGVAECLERDYSVKPASPLPFRSESSSPHLGHLWGIREVRQLVRIGDLDAATAVAHELGLVTPVTSALVLESQRDYEANGITPPSTTRETGAGAFTGVIPTTPEPDDLALLAALILFTGSMIWFQHRSRWANHG